MDRAVGSASIVLVDGHLLKNGRVVVGHLKKERRREKMIGVWDEFGMNLTDSRTEDASKGDEDKYWESGVAVERKEIHIPQPGSRQGFLSEFGW